MSEFWVGAVLDAEKRLCVRMVLPVMEERWHFTPAEARRLAEQLLAEAAFAENWQAVIEKQEARKR